MRPGLPSQATLAGYFVWGWDNLNIVVAAPLANEADYAATLRFLQQTRHKQVGILHAFTGSFQPLYKGPFPWLAQFIAALYHAVSTSGEVIIQAPAAAKCTVDGQRIQPAHDPATGTMTIPTLPGRPIEIKVSLGKERNSST